MQSIKDTDAESGLHYKAPRVSLTDIENAIAKRLDVNAGALAGLAAGPVPTDIHAQELDPLRVMSLCVLVLKNGWVVVGKSAPASPENFNAEYGRKLAYEDAVRQVWPLMGFALKARTHEGW
jgi:hypothetical protein